MSHGGPKPELNACPRVAITGMGLVTALGTNRHQAFEALCAGRVGIGPLTALPRPELAGRGGGQALQLPHCPETCDMPREARYLRFAVETALVEAKLRRGVYAPHRCGVMIGTTLHGMTAAEHYFRDRDLSHFRDFLAPSIVRQAMAGFGFRGPAATTCSACSSGLGSIALAVTLLQCGELDVVIAGGYDPICEYSYAGFNSLRLIADGPVRPFCRDRKGMKVAEGYGVLVLEREDDAQRRGVRPAAVVAGYGESADAHHLTQPRPDGQGAAEAIGDAMRHAGMTADDVGMICAHATGTPDNDGAEYQALRAALGPRLRDVPCVAIKGQLGHTLGAAGAVELILAATAIEAGRVPASHMSASSEVEFDDLRLSDRAGIAARPSSSLNVSLGFGGANTCVIIRRPDGTTAISKGQVRQDVWITGVGVLVPGAIGNDAFAALICDERRPAVGHDSGGLTDDDVLPLVPSRRVRRMSDYVKLTLAAVTVATRDAGFADVAAMPDNVAAILGTCHGSANFSEAFHEQILREGLDAANPFHFAEGVPNAAAAHLSLMLGARRACQTILGSRTSGLDALRLASLRISRGEWDRAIVAVSEEFCPLVNAAYGACGMYRKGEAGFAVGSGGVALILESADAASRRGVEPRAIVDSVAAATFEREQLRDAIAQGVRVMDQLGWPDHVLGSANQTWIDDFESAVWKRRPGEAPRTATIYGRIAETYSVMPLASIAAVLLSGRWPDHQPAPPSFAVSCTDANGLFAAAKLTLAGRSTEP